MASTQEKAASHVLACQDRVYAATTAYQNGGSLSAVNKANKALADAHYEFDEIRGGRIPVCNDY